MRWDCETVREHLDAWSLGGLDAYETRAVESHVASCAECQLHADDAQAHAAMLGMAVPLRGSSATLKARVLASARALTDIGRHGVSRWWRVATGAAAAISVAAIAWGVAMQMEAGDLRDERATLAAQATSQAVSLRDARTQVVTLVESRDALDQAIDEQNEVINIVFQPNTESTELNGTEIAPGATGRCIWSRTKALGAFVADDMPVPPPGKEYTMWLVYERAWINGGSFDVDEHGRGHLVLRKIWSSRDNGALIGFAVTVEDVIEPLRPSDELVLTSPAPWLGE
jgi:hypothetical protein